MPFLRTLLKGTNDLFIEDADMSLVPCDEPQHFEIHVETDEFLAVIEITEADLKRLLCSTDTKREPCAQCGERDTQLHFDEGFDDWLCELCYTHKRKD